MGDAVAQSLSTRAQDRGHVPLDMMHRALATARFRFIWFALLVAFRAVCCAYMDNNSQTVCQMFDQGIHQSRCPLAVAGLEVGFVGMLPSKSSAAQADGALYRSTYDSTLSAGALSGGYPPLLQYLQ